MFHTWRQKTWILQIHNGQWLLVKHWSIKVKNICRHCWHLKCIQSTQFYVQKAPHICMFDSQEHQIQHELSPPDSHRKSSDTIARCCGSTTWWQMQKLAQGNLKYIHANHISVKAGNARISLNIILPSANWPKVINVKRLN